MQTFPFIECGWEQKVKKNDNKHKKTKIGFVWLTPLTVLSENYRNVCV
jgi:hypothetical protein